MDIQDYINPTYKKLHDLDLKLELRSGSNGWDKVYLTDSDGVRLTDALYRGNWEKGNSDERFRTARQGSHKDTALKELFNKYKRIEEYGIEDVDTTMKKEFEEKLFAPRGRQPETMELGESTVTKNANQRWSKAPRKDETKAKESKKSLRLGR